MARKIDPNSKRSIQKREREAKKKAKELAALLVQQEATAKELAEEQAARIAELERQAAQLQEEKEFVQEEEGKAVEPEQKKETTAPEVDENDLMSLVNDAITKEKKVVTDTEEAKGLTVDNDFDGDFDPPEEGKDDDLKYILNQVPTKHKEKKSKTNSKEDFEKYKEDFYAPEELEKEAPEIIKESKQAGKVKAVIPPNEMADIFIEGLDGLLQYGGPIAYGKLAFSKEERKRLRRIAHNASGKKKEVVYTDEDLELLDRFEEMEKYNDNLPLTAKEKKSLKVPLKVLLQDRGGDIPPGWALAYAATMTALPRIAPLLALQISKHFQKIQIEEDNEQESDEAEEEEQTLNHENETS